MLWLLLTCGLLLCIFCLTWSKTVLSFLLAFCCSSFFCLSLSSSFAAFPSGRG